MGLDCQMGFNRLALQVTICQGGSLSLSLSLSLTPPPPPPPPHTHGGWISPVLLKICLGCLTLRTDKESQAIGAKMEGHQVIAMWQKAQVFYQGILDNGDKRTDNWLLVYSPAPISAIFLCYLLLIWAGPKLMANRQPVNLKLVLILYNSAMVCLSAYMFHEFTAASWLSRYSLLCQPVDYSESPLAMRMARVCWWFYFSKVVELSDTMFFILRKKNNQLTFLHVYHHTTMIFNWWAGVKYVAGGQSFLIGLINSLVHVVMYLYYALAALGPSMTKYLWWKRYLTILQLVQFFIVSIHTAYNLFADCDFPDTMNMVVLAYSFSLIVLFAHFYSRSYLTSKKTA
uniref:ELOVL fatty acid elongase 8a n=1 Tax=Doryrhamphus excisus TaxID=161450 RepID=UPI0025ADBA0A|nr:ELOVL fatty acid elongase 8a [Doryrhamphus excisus]